MRSGDYQAAVGLLRELIQDGSKHPRVWSTLAVAWRKLGNTGAAAEAIHGALERDPLDFLAVLEEWQRGDLAENEIHALLDRHDPSFVGSQLYLEGAISYGELGDWEDAARVIEAGVRHFQASGQGVRDARLLSWLRVRTGWPQGPGAGLFPAGSGSRQHVRFSIRPVDIEVLRTAIARNPTDCFAWTYLGDALFFLRRYEDANQAWARSLEINGKNPTALRNLALGTWAVEKNVDRAISLLQRASAADVGDARLLLELDQMLQFAGKTSRRAELLAERDATVRQRDELVLSWAKLLLRLQQFEKASGLMDSRRFFARESRAGTHAIYAEAHSGAGESMLAAGKPEQALEQFRKALEYPENLGEGAPAGEVATRVRYLTALAYEASGDSTRAHKLWDEAAAAPVKPGTESVVYQALALKKLDRQEEARETLLQLAAGCEKRPDAGGDEPVRLYVLSRADAELGNRAEADRLMRAALEKDPDVVLHARIIASQPPGLPAGP